LINIIDINRYDSMIYYVTFDRYFVILSSLSTCVFFSLIWVG